MPPVSPRSHPSLWDFSLDLYARPGVAATCLHLQDTQGISINLLLWCAWLDACGVLLNGARLQDAQQRIHHWDVHYVMPLRYLRRSMKNEFGTADKGIEAVRAQIKQAELMAEKHLQSGLETMASDWENKGEANLNVPLPWSNVYFYLHHMNVSRVNITKLIEMLRIEADGNT